MTELQQPVSSLPQLLLESMKAVHPIPQAAGMNELPSVVRDVVAPGMLEETLGALEWSVGAAMGQSTFTADYD